MKKIYPRTIILFLFLLLLGTEGVKGQLLLNYDFTGLTTASNLAGQDSWTKGGSGPDATVENTTPLTYTGYNGGGGNYVQSPAGNATASRVYRGYTSTSIGTNTIYYSFLLRVSATTTVATTGNYFVSLGDPGTNTAYFARVSATQGVSASKFRIGGSKLSNTMNYSTTEFDINTTYLVVVKYVSVTGTTNDEMYIWVNPSLASEPSVGSADVTVPATGADPTLTGGNLGNFHWHNRLIDNATVAFDGVRVAIGATSADAWTNLAPAVAATPAITVTPASLSGFTTTAGTPSASQNYSLSGSNLTPASGGITVTAPTDYEVSLNNTTFLPSLSIPYASGTLSATTIYVRIAASAPVGSPSGNVTNEGGGASTQNVAVSGTVNPVTPFLTVTPASLSGFTTTAGSPSASQNYTLSGGNLTPASGNITVTAPTDYEVSTDNTTFSGSVSVPYSGGTLASTPIYVRIAASAPVGSPSGNVSNAGGGATTQNVAVSGTVNPAPTVVPIATIRNSISAAPNLEQVAPYAVGTPVIVRGVLHGVNRNVDGNPANGTKQRFEFALIDNSGVRSGITVRLNGTVDVAPIDLQEGDSVQISGTVAQFRGLTQVDVNLGSVTRLATGRPRKTPVTATVIGEDQESNLIRLDNVSVTSSAWPATPHTTGPFNINITVGSNTYVMRITSASELFNKTYAQVFGPSEPTTGITIIGVGGQFGGNSAPFNTGYQIFPYRLSDIIAPVPIVPELGSNAPTAGFDFGTVRKNEVSASVSYKLKGKDLPITGSNTNTVVTAPANFQVSKNNTDFFDFITFTNAEVMADSVNAFVRFAPTSETNGFKAGDVTNAVPATNPTLNINVAVKGTQAEPLSLADALASQVKVYPNPARSSIQIESNQLYEVELQDITGRKVSGFASDEVVKIDNLANGLYILQFKKDNIKFAKRLVIQK